MNILIVPPGRTPESVTVPNTLKAMQEIVGGPIEAIYPYEDAVALVCHEEGKLLRLPLNRAVRDPSTGTVIDIISGTFFICGLGEDDFASLSCEQIAYYSKLFQNPEIFLQSGAQLIIFQIEQ